MHSDTISSVKKD